MYQNRTINKRLLGGNELAAHMYQNNPRMIPQALDPQCYQMFITVPITPEKKKGRKKNLDIRKLFDKSKESGVIG